MTIELRDRGERVEVRRQDDPAALAALTIERVDARGQYVWTGRRGTGTVQRKAREAIARRRPDLYASGFLTPDGLRITSWTNSDPTYSGPGTGKATFWWGEAQKRS